MGLFDNLFLDANTPITINDGVDHSKDVVQAIVDPVVPEKSGDPSSGVEDSDTQGIKQDDSFVTLFEEDKKDEMNAEKILNPDSSSATDVALEIGLDAAKIPNTDDTPNIDIGGDFNFDIGGDMVGGGSDTTFSLDGTPSLGGDGVMADGVIDASAGSTGSGSEIISGESIVGADAMGDDGTPADSALFSLLNEDPVSQNPDSGESLTSSEGISTSTEVGTNILSETAEPSTGTGADPAFSSLFNISEADTSGISSTSVEAAPISEAVAPPIIDPSIVTPPVSIEPVSISTFSVPDSLIGQSVSMNSALTNLTGSPKLKAKLTEFLGELESMDFGDQSKKEHKKQQIEMYEMRIAEIKAETDIRIRALQLEILTLEREIQEMDNEKNHIKTVIETLQRETEVV